MHFLRAETVLRIEYSVIELDHTLIKLEPKRNQTDRMDMPCLRTQSRNPTRAGASGGGEAKEHVAPKTGTAMESIARRLQHKSM